jgi:solute carrier family 25 (mitochondrial uncoupling protein), member 8/9
MVLGYGLLKEGIPCHLFCATLAGITTVIIGSPVDVLKTRVMNAKKGVYSSPLDCIIKTAKYEGIGAFYKGFIPNCVRLAGWN